MDRPDRTAAARELTKRASYGILSTISQQLPDYPTGALMPYGLTVCCEPIVCISSLSAHTQDIQTHPQVTLTVVDPDSVPESLAGARFSYSGLATAVAPKHRPQIRQQYLLRQPSAQLYVDFGDFKFYVIRLHKGRYIGGFGGASWIDPEHFAVPDPIATWATDHLDELNTACSSIVEQAGNLPGEGKPKLAGIDGYGLDICRGDRRTRLEFTTPLETQQPKLDAIVSAITQRLTIAR